MSKIVILLFSLITFLFGIGGGNLRAQTTIQECDLSNPQCPTGTTCQRQQFQTKAYCVASQSPVQCDPNNPQCPAGKVCRKEQFQSTGFCVDLPPTYQTCDPNNPVCPSGKVCRQEQFQATGYCVDPPPTLTECDLANPQCPTGKVCRKEQFQTKAYCVDAPPTIVPIGDKATAGGIPCGDPDNPGIKTAIGCIHTNPVGLVKDFLTFATGISGGLAFLMMILGAFQMLTSAGNPETLQAGRDRFTSAIIGLLIVIFAVLLLQIIGFDILKIPGFGK